MKAKKSQQSNKKVFSKKFKPKKDRIKSRKELRKELRQAKKQRQQQHTLNRLGRAKKVVPEDLPIAELTPNKCEIPTKSQAPAKKIPDAKAKILKKKVKFSESIGPTPNLQTEKRRLSEEMRRERAKQLRIANKDEDKNIKKLEKLLKMNRRKSKTIPKAFVDDGLDYLLDVCDPEKLNSIRTRQADDESSGSEFEDDLAAVTGKPTKKEQDSESNDPGSDFDEDLPEDEEECEEFSDDCNSEEGSVSDEDTPKSPIQNTSSHKKTLIKTATKLESKKIKQSKIPKEKKKKKIIEEEEEFSDEVDDSLMGSNDENDDSLGEEDEMESIGGSDEENDTKPDHWEDIYGRKRDKQGNVIKETSGRYVPPALREKSGPDSVKLLRLKRQIQGLLNRVAESNMGGVASQLETIMSSHSRGDACEVLGQLVLAAVAPPHCLTPTKLAAEHALLLALLHAHIGSDIGATFLQTTVKLFDKKYSEEHDAENKSLNNLLLILCFLYSFKIFHCILMFDILQKLSTRFEEKDVELILLVLKLVGPCLRKDDPAMLKDIIIQLQKQASATTKHAENARVRFMLDVLLAIKNNNMSRIPDYDPDLVDHLRKVLRGLLRRGAQVSELKISLEDLLNAEERGRWWVVGSAWQGAGPGAANPATQKSQLPGQNYSEKLLELARKQRMNTDVRRNIFCILMTAEDFLDAFEKLLHLGLKGQQERELSYVLLDCCLQEQTYNPYYYHLAQKFCDFDRKHKMTLQCSIWDKLKDVSNLSSSQLRNISSFTFNLILSNGLNLSILKVLEFADLDKKSVKFLRQVLLGLLLCDGDEKCAEAFSRVPSSPQLSLFRESLNVFLHKYIVRNQKNVPEGTDFDLLTSRVSLAQKILTNVDAKVAF